MGTKVLLIDLLQSNFHTGRKNVWDFQGSEKLVPINPRPARICSWHLVTCHLRHQYATSGTLRFVCLWRDISFIFFLTRCFILIRLGDKNKMFSTRIKSRSKVLFRSGKFQVKVKESITNLYFFPFRNPPPSKTLKVRIESFSLFSHKFFSS